MYSQTKRNALFTLGLMLAFVLACSAFSDETDKANKLVAEGNAAITEGNRLLTEANAKGNKDMDEALDDFTKSGEKYREASKKFDEASKLKVGDQFKEYLTLKSQEFGKRAELVEVTKKNTQAMLDNPDIETMSARLQEFKTQIEKLDKEAKDLETKAEKIRSENKDKIK